MQFEIQDAELACRSFFCVPYRAGCREPGPAMLAVVPALPGFHPYVCALRLPQRKAVVACWKIRGLSKLGDLAKGEL